MFEITKIEEQKKDLNRSSVFINGEFAFGVTNQTIKRYDLKVGMIFSKEQYETLLRGLQLDKAKGSALNYISHTNRTEKQVREKLLKLEYEQTIIEQVIDFLKRYQYINDTVYVKEYIRQGLKHKHKSLRKLQSELYYKGIMSVEVHNEEVEVLEKESILKLLDKYRYSYDLEHKDKQKIIRKLLNKGYSYSLIKECLYKVDESIEY